MYVGPLTYPRRDISSEKTHGLGDDTSTQQPKHKTMSRGLVFDIETSPLIAYTWGMYEDSVIEVIEDYQILTVAWQWVGEKKVHCVGQDDFLLYEPGVNNDLEVVKTIWKLLNEADYVVAHNGDQFDIKKVNARIMIHDLPPYAPVKQIDTKKLAKRVGGFTSNRLKHLAQDLNVNQKGDPGGFGTWKGCLAGDPKAWKKMKKYNKQDIPPLMDLYLKFRPWDKSGYQHNVAEGRPNACPKCGAAKMYAGMKYRATNTNLYQYFRCMECGGMAKSRIPEPKRKEEMMQFVS